MRSVRLWPPSRSRRLGSAPEASTALLEGPRAPGPGRAVRELRPLRAGAVARAAAGPRDPRITAPRWFPVLDLRGWSYPKPPSYLLRRLRIIGVEVGNNSNKHVR